MVTVGVRIGFTLIVPVAVILAQLVDKVIVYGKDPNCVGVPEIVNVALLADNVAATPAGKPVLPLMLFTLAKLWVIGVMAVLRQASGDEDAAPAAVALTIVVLLAGEYPAHPVV